MQCTANVRTKILDFRGFDSSIILLQGWDFHVHREFPRHFASSDLGRDNLSREIGRIALRQLPGRCVTVSSPPKLGTSKTESVGPERSTANPRAENLDFRELYSSRVLSLKGWSS